MICCAKKTIVDSWTIVKQTCTIIAIFLISKWLEQARQKGIKLKKLLEE